jgi:hypothetical protein
VTSSPSIARSPSNGPTTSADRISAALQHRPAAPFPRSAHTRPSRHPAA